MLKDLAIEVPARAKDVALPDPTRMPSLEEVRARAGVYRLLSAVFVEEADPDFIDAVRCPESLAALAEAGVRFEDDFLAPDWSALKEALAIEFSSLFIASGGFPPLESVRLTGRLQQEPYYAVKSFYRQLGFQVLRGKFHVFDDQLGVELMFVAEMLERMEAALESGDAGEARRVEREIKRFWALHLGKWVRGYARLVIRAAQHSFYREMAKLLLEFSEEEIRGMALRIEDADGGRLQVPKKDIKVEFNPDEPVCNGCGAGDRLRELRN